MAEPREDTISLIHPNFYNQAFRALGIDYLHAAENKAGGVVVMATRESYLGDLANVIALAATRKMVVESNAGAIKQVCDSLRQVRGLQAHDYQALEDAIERLTDVHNNLTRSHEA